MSYSKKREEKMKIPHGPMAVEKAHRMIVEFDVARDIAKKKTMKNDEKCQTGYIWLCTRCRNHRFMSRKLICSRFPGAANSARRCRRPHFPPMASEVRAAATGHPVGPDRWKRIRAHNCRAHQLRCGPGQLARPSQQYRSTDQCGCIR